MVTAFTRSANLSKSSSVCQQGVREGYNTYFVVWSVGKVHQVILLEERIFVYNNSIATCCVRV